MKFFLILFFLGIGCNVQSQETSFVISIGGPIDSIFLRLNDTIANEILPKTDTLYLYNEQFLFEPNTYILSIKIDSNSINENSDLTVIGVDNFLIIKTRPSKFNTQFELLQRTDFDFKIKRPYFVPFGTDGWFRRNKMVQEVDIFQCSAQLIYFKSN